MTVEEKEIDFFIGSKIGSFKHVKYNTDSAKNNKKCIENIIDVKTLVKDEGITRMEWGNTEQNEILIGRQNQQVQIFNTLQDTFTRTVTADYGTGHIVGLGKHNRKLITALSSGVVKIWSKKDEVILETGGQLDVMRCCADDTSLFATGGQENDVKIWRVGERAPTFIAKNLPNDWLELRQPVWVSDVAFVPGSNGVLIAACSRYGYVRLYDTRAQRRPVCNVEFKSMAATCIVPSFDEKQFLVGFGRGQVHQVDLRDKGKPDKGFKGAAGAITSLALVKEPRMVVSVSLDRHCRVHDYESKDMVYKQYLTSKLTTVLVQNEGSTPLRKSHDTEVKDEVEVKEEDDLDQLFEDMETVGDKPKKKKLTESTNVKSKKVKTEDEPEVNNEDAIKKLLLSTKKKNKNLQKNKKGNKKDFYRV